VKLWLSKNSEVPVRDQLVAQITLGIASGDLPPGNRLPSTRELARRFNIHQNTVSSAYRELAAKGVVEFKKGSGVFIAKGEINTESSGLQQLVSRFLELATSAGYSSNEIKEHILKALEPRSPNGFLVIESDEALREILLHEIRAGTGANADGTTLEEFSTVEEFTAKRHLVAMFDEEEKLKYLLPAGSSCTYLKANSVPTSMSGETRPGKEDLIVIASGWDKFLAFAKLFLLAANVDATALITRLTNESNWKRGIDQAAMVVCDPLTAMEFPDDGRVRVFPLIAESSLKQLQGLAANYSGFQ